MIMEKSFGKFASRYLESIVGCFDDSSLVSVERLAKILQETWRQGKNVFICGNGGSAANAMHLANDLHYGISCGEKKRTKGMRVEALCSNSALLTCLANDTGYENIYSDQVLCKGEAGDLLIVLSGSGNSANVVNAINAAKLNGIRTASIVGFQGGECKKISDLTIHFKVQDMQIAEDLQLVAGHICMQWLRENATD